LSLSEDDGSCALQNKKLLQSFHAYYDSKKCFYSTENEPSLFACLLRLLVYFIVGTSEALATNYMSHHENGFLCS
jgi:hypothetical protein